MLAFGIAEDTPFPSPGSLNLVQELNHRVINQYAEAIATLTIASARAPAPSARRTLDDAAERLRDHAECHRALFPPATAGLLNLADYVAHICNSYTKATLAARGVHLVLKSDDIWLASERAWRIGLIIAELVRNAARHGLKGKEGRIFVHLSDLKGQVGCRVSDTGSGTPGASPGWGQNLVQSLVADLGGTAEWVFTPLGNCALLRLPGTETPRPKRTAVGRQGR
jgi:two-component sensor histidine kinase